MPPGLSRAFGSANPGKEPLDHPAARVDGEADADWRITVSPFAQDRNRDKLREHAARRYEFSLSEAVPGGVYEFRMLTPGGDGAPLVEDRLAFERSQPPQGASR